MSATTGRRQGQGRELVDQQLADLRELRRRLLGAVLPHELDETRRSLDAAMAALDHHNPASNVELLSWVDALWRNRRRRWSTEDDQMFRLLLSALASVYPAPLEGEHAAIAWRRLWENHQHPGTWEAGPASDECCASCGAWVDPTKAQFFGISNGDWAWCCSLRCLIAEAQGEQEFYTDGAGPEEGPVAQAPVD